MITTTQNQITAAGSTFMSESGRLTYRDHHQRRCDPAPPDSASAVPDCRHGLHRASPATGQALLHSRQRRGGENGRSNALVLSEPQQVQSLALVERVTRRASVWRKRQARLLGAERGAAPADCPLMGRVNAKVRGTDAIRGRASLLSPPTRSRPGQGRSLWEIYAGP
jgi:hypothetical protein